MKKNKDKDKDKDIDKIKAKEERERRKNKHKNFTYCKEHSKAEGAYYANQGVGLNIYCETEGTIGKMTGWELAIAPDTLYKGITQEQLISKLKEVWSDLEWYTKHTRDKVLIYTSNIHKIQGFFEKYITESFEDFYVILNEHFDVRPCERWMDAKKAANDTLYMANQAQTVINDYFIPAKYFFITPQQRNRKVLAKMRKECDDTVAVQSYPATFERYKQFRKGYFAGLLYHPYQGIIEEPMLVLDITSSYIYSMLMEKHVSSSYKKVEPSMWQYYLSSATKCSLGMYNVKYAMPLNHISCFTDVKGQELEPGEHEATMVLTNVDMQNLLSLGYIKEVNIVWLYEFEKEYLPEYAREEIVNAYIAKVEAGNNKALKAIRKPILNGFYGDTIRRYEDEEAFNNTRKDPTLSPLWGIFTTSYSKQNLLNLALKVDGWYYSDTDSIICKDTKENRAFLEEHNRKVMAIVKEWCERFGYDYELMKDLGTFKVEHEIVKMKVWKTKTYCYKTVTGEVILKAAGLVKGSVEENEKLFNMKELPYERMSFPIVVPASQSKTGEGYYAEIKPTCKAQYYVLLRMLQENNKNYSKR